MTPARIKDTRNGPGPVGILAAGSTTTLQIGGANGVPTSAAAVFVNFTVVNATTGQGWFTPYPADESKPGVSLNFRASANTAIGSTVELSSTGAIKIYNSSSEPINLVVDLLGYFSATTTVGAFTPAALRVAANRTITANATVSVPVAGVGGIPVVGSGIIAVAFNLQVSYSGTTGGSERVWASDQTEPGTSSLNLMNQGAITSNFITTAVGADGQIKIHNISNMSVSYWIDVQGWYTSVSAAVPSGQTRTQQFLTLRGTATGGGDWVAYKYRTGTVGVPSTFVSVPVGDVVVPGTTTHPSAWPVTRTSGVFAPYTWDVAATLGSTADALIQVQACFGVTSTDANPVCSMPSNVTFSQSAFGDSFATEGVGPGTVSLLTGDYQVTDTDVSASSYQGSLSIARSLTTLHPSAATTTATGVFGPGWTADLTGPDAGAGSITVNDQAAAGYLVLTDASDGSVSTYQATSSISTYPISFVGVDDAASDAATVTKVNATTITLLDSDATLTTWTKPASGIWSVATVAQTGSGSASTYTYNAAGLVTRILAPVPTGVTCTTPDTTPGCRSLTFTYATIAAAQRLSTVRLVAANPASGDMTPIAVAAYDYTTGGVLADVNDPRITPNLKTAYTYGAGNRLATVTPPGLAAWALTYDAGNRLLSASRPDAALAATATSTVIYAVPFTGSGAPIELGAATTAAWSQTDDLPATATGVFGPDHTPAGTTFPTVASADWPFADLHYLDANGRETNSASYGASAWQIDTTRYDTTGTSIWALTAGNRARALTPVAGVTDSVVAATSGSAARADLLASTSVYDPLHPAQVSASYGSLHPVVLTDGTTVHARSHTATSYDEGAPTADWYGLPSTSVSSAWTTDGVDHDPITTRTGYAAIVSGDATGWALRQATTSTVQMGVAPSTADLTTTTRYNPAGQNVESRLPGAAVNGSGVATDARTTITVFYTATGTGACVSAALAGLVCTVGPAVQPSTGNPLPVKSFTYDRFTAVETAGATVRTTSNGVDAAERTITKTIAVTPTPAGGTALPTVTYSYDTGTGLPTTQATTTGAVTTTLTTGYDTLGRATAYTDATGTTSSTSYDIAGHPVTLNDGKLTSTFTYDTANTEHRGLVTAQDIGVTGSPSIFTADYNADGAIADVTYPTGLVATTSYDNEANPTTLSYDKSASNWLTFTASRDAQDRVRTQTSPTSNQAYSYDPAGRLTQVQDTVAASCVTRVYGFDTDSNRTSLKSYPAGTGGVCSTATTPVTTTSGYDQGDRLTAAGYTYDTLGRTTAVPAGDALGIGANAATIGALGVDYYSNDLIHGQTQAAATRTYSLDPTQNRITAFDDGVTTTTNHYTDSGDNPAWTETGAAWTDTIAGIAGDLAATTDQTGTVTLHLPNLHGDLVADCADTTTATGVTSYNESTEYGAPRTAATADSTYGWLGAKQRSTNTFGGLTLMGVRLYNPTTGKFLTTDPVPGGNPNPYTYPTDPINSFDLTGQWGWKRVWRHIKKNWNNYAVAGACVFGGPGACALASGLNMAYKASTHQYHSWRDVAFDGSLAVGGWGAGRAISGGWRMRNVVQKSVRSAGRSRGAHRAAIDWRGTSKNWGSNAAITGASFGASWGWSRRNFW